VQLLDFFDRGLRRLSCFPPELLLGFSSISPFGFDGICDIFVIVVLVTIVVVAVIVEFEVL
jgi:hypothetical protein